MGQFYYSRAEYLDARKWLWMASQAGDAKAQFFLARIYDAGKGVPADCTEAAKWYRKAADAGVSEAQFNLGLMYQHGECRPTNLVEAVRWFRMAAQAGLAEAQANLGVCLLNGQGSPTNQLEAVGWLTKAADAGSVPAAYALGTVYENGTGVSQNFALAVKWFRIAAEKDHALAQRNLGVTYAKGRGVPRDNVQAYVWLFRAASKGEDASKLLEGLRASMSPEQVRDAETQAAAGLVQGQQPQPPKPEVHIQPAAPSATVAVVSGSAPTPPVPVSAGTGFFVTDDGYFLTCYHCVGGATKIGLRVGAREIPARLIWSNPGNDVALLKANGWFSALPIVPSACVRLGDSVSTVGFPNIQVQGVSPKFTRGEINALAGIQDDPRFFQVSLPVQPGNSGGPLVDTKGNVVGIVAARLKDAGLLSATGYVAQNVNYCVKSSVALDGLPTLARRPKSGTKPRELPDVAQSVEVAVAIVVNYR